jgi:TonB family protein
MTRSDTAAQQRETQEKRLQRFITYSLAGSLALHTVVMGLRVDRPQDLPRPEPEELSVLVMEPPEETPPPEDILPEPQPTQPAPAQPTVSSAAPATELIEPSPLPSPLPQAPQPVATPQPQIQEPVTQEVPVAEPDEVATEPAPAPIASPSATPTGESASTADDDRPPGLPRSFVPSASGDAVATGPGPNSGISSPGNGASETNRSDAGGDRPASTTRSREITCRGCNFDYPDRANGAEGTARVIVETDADGRVVGVTLARSSGNAELDRAALQQARQRVRLNNARAGESYPLDIEFVRPGSSSASRNRPQNDRRSITVTETVPAEPAPTPAAATNPAPSPSQSPASSAESPSPQTAPLPAAVPSPAPDTSPEGTPEPVPSRAPASVGTPTPSRSEPTPSPDRSPAAQPSPSPRNTPRATPASRPAATPASRPRIERDAPIVDVPPERPRPPRPSATPSSTQRQFRPLPRRTPRPAAEPPAPAVNPPPPAEADE